MLATCSAITLPHLAAAQTTAVTPAITTPDKVESQLGVLEFKDGAPDAVYAIANIPLSALFRGHPQ
jgi:hypothetical protein